MSSLKDKKSSRTEAPAPPRVVIGRIAGMKDGAPLVDFPDNPAGAPVSALATARYDLAPEGAAVALMFIDGDPARPLVVGLIETPTDAVTPSTPEDRVTITAAREIVFQCGRASIVLTRAGKVLVRGAYLSLRSSGMHRITGASVQIN